MMSRRAYASYRRAQAASVDHGDGQVRSPSERGNHGITNHQPARPHPGTCAMLREGRSSGLPSSFPGHAFPCVSTVALDQGRQAYSSGGCAGLARDGYRARHRLPVSPSGRRAGGHHSLVSGILQGGMRDCHRIIVLADGAASVLRASIAPRLERPATDSWRPAGPGRSLPGFPTRP